MSPLIPTPPSLKRLPGAADPLALLEMGLRPASVPRPELALSVEEVSAMLPAYAVERAIGQGGMGAVFAAVQRDLQRRVAIKVLSPALAETPGLTLRFRHESQLMASLHHPGVVQVYEAGETAEGHLYYVMEFVDGEDLASRLRRGQLSLEDAVPLVAQVAEALQAAHALGIVHRDVKPANIFLSAHGPPRLGDFGLALTAEQAAEALRLTRPGTTVGTLEYAAPEQLSRSHPVSPATDVFSLGVLTYEMLTGALPRGNFDPPSLCNAAVDAAFDSVVLRALQTDPARRYADAGEFRAAFLQAADRRRQQALREEAVRRKMARRARLVAALASVSVLTGGSAFVAWRSSREAESARQDAVAKQSLAETAEHRMAGLLRFMLTDLRRRLEPTGNLGAMDSVLEKAVEHFRRKHAESGLSPETAQELADVLVVKADVIGVRGLGEAADALYTEAIALTAEARDAAPLDEDRALRAIQALQDRVEHRQASNRYDEALTDARLLLSEAQAAADRIPGSRLQHAVAAAHRAIAHALGYTGPLEEARDEYLRAESILRSLAAAATDDQALAGELADLDISLGSNAEARGDLQEMLRRFTAWHGSVEKRYGRDSNMYSHAAFRMGVALQKLARANEAIPYLTDAVRIAERDAAAEPGHKGHLNHVSWCLRFLALAHEDAGHTKEAAEFRTREAAVKREMETPADAGAPDAAAEFARLLTDTDATRDKWWAFCQSLERRAETLGGTAAARTFYGEWIARISAAAPAGERGALVHLATAFLHNRLAVDWLKEDPAQSSAHAREALALREALAAAHPEETEFQRDVLSSSLHAAAAAVKGTSSDDAAAAFTGVVTAARSMSEKALVQRDNGLFYAGKSADLLDEAAARWPAAASFRQAGRDISAAILDRLPPGPAVQSLRQRLTASSGN